MVIDKLINAANYYCLHPRLQQAFAFLISRDLEALDALEKGKHPIDGDNLFAIVNFYDTVDPATEQMESHKKYIDLQFIVTGQELIGHAFLEAQTPSQAYDAEKDFMLFAETPDFFTKLEAGSFAIFFPTDLHMPNLRVIGPEPVKKIVIKIAVSE
ncbi:MAG: YhcH/YjgK/YiaL family protein [Candidatus Pseudobacter hemicellulosilyticus]|uniref:YhcH/YjgK/YiaL family protein n=1 Tax=Candidatus Pseudobacter hemicellulosilyticus TaxID=3121375 RepID=A0AAJ5WP11_9BACT|nr:MAG: YhcH/YjgK/YiaL family protein [Pseudobacter sp.]